MEDYPRLSRWVQCNHGGPYKREAEGQSQRRCDDRSRGQRERLEDATCLALKMREGP